MGPPRKRPAAPSAMERTRKNGPFHPLVVPLSEPAAHEDGSTAPRTDRNADEDVGEGGGGADGSEGVLPHKPAKNHRVRDVINLLKDAPQDDRKRKDGQRAKRRIPDQIFKPADVCRALFHGCSPFRNKKALQHGAAERSLCWEPVFSRHRLPCGSCPSDGTASSVSSGFRRRASVPSSRWHPRCRYRRPAP